MATRGKKGSARKPAAGAAPLLIELRTEELPPKALARLMEAFSHGLVEALREKHFLLPESGSQPYATPRRLAVVISQVLAQQADRMVERKGPAVASATGPDGQPTPALLGFARSCGVDVGKLERQAGEKGEYFVYRAKQKGEPLAKHLATIVEAVLKKLPVPKLMRWGSGEAQFVRPVHGVMLVHGNKVVPGTVLGLKSGNKTLGHRFLGKGALTIARATDYEKVLKAGKVLASFESRREAIARGLDAAARKLGARWDLGKSAELVDEVTSIVEWPVVLTGGFDKAFLDVPKECLIISMQQHQKYFPLVDGNGRLLPQFLFVSNQQAPNPKQIISGNERVLRARLSDARFFYDQDRKTRLETRVPRLANVVYHNQLGSQLQRVERIEKLAGEIARLLGANDKIAMRAARLAKADLLTDMVGEFPELQGIMGEYYAHHDGETHVAVAIREHYLPRYAGDVLPASVESISVALADKIDTLVGMFGIGSVPTGDKDPFGLRRQALGVIRMLVERAGILPSLDIVGLLQQARSFFPDGVVADSVAQDVHGFMLERLKPYLRDRQFEAGEIDAVLSLNPTRLDDVMPRLAALQKFRKLPEAEALAAANKRIVNILRKTGKEHQGADAGKLTEPAERLLFDALRKLQPEIESCFKAHDYTGALQRLAALKRPVDAFFDGVMVMTDDVAVRANRLALLGDLKAMMNRVADISKLAA